MGPKIATTTARLPPTATLGASHGEKVGRCRHESPLATVGSPRMPEAATNPSPELPALPPAADLEARTVLKHCLAAHAALVELRLTAQRHSTAAMVAAKMRLEAQDSTAPPTHGRRDDHPGHDGAACHSALLRAVHSLSALALSARIAAAIAEAVTTGPCSRHCRAGAARPGSLCVGSLDPILAAWKRCLKAPSVLDPFVRAAVQHSHLLARNPFAVASGPAGRWVHSPRLRVSAWQPSTHPSLAVDAGPVEPVHGRGRR